MFPFLTGVFCIIVGVVYSRDGEWYNPSYSPINNIDSAMRGYNLYIAEPFTSQIDPGFRQLIFESTKRNPDGTVGLQSGIDATNDLSCVTNTDEAIISTMEEYRNDQIQNTVIGTEWSIGPEMEVNAGIEAGPLNVGITKKIEPFIQDQETDSKRLTELEQFFTIERGVLVKLEATCRNNIIILDRHHLPEFKPGFKASVRKLYDAAKLSKEQRIKEFKYFVKDYGTHYSRETHLGARLIYNRRFTKRDQKMLKNKDSMDCSKQESKLSLFATLRTHSNKCRETVKVNTTGVSDSVTREEIVTFGSRLSEKAADWYNQEMTGQVPIKQLLTPILTLFEQDILSQIDNSMIESNILPWLRPLFDDICNIMGYSCQGENPCGVRGVNYTCRYDQQCTRLWFAGKGEKRFYCEDSKAMVHWERVPSATVYVVKLFKFGSDFQIRKYSDQCVYRYCNASFPEVENADNTFVYEVTPLVGKPYYPYKNLGRYTWTLGWFPLRKKSIRFRRFGEVAGYHINIGDLVTLRTLTHYVEQCQWYLSSAQSLICEAGLSKMFTKKWLIRISKVTMIRCYNSQYNSLWRKPRKDKMKEILKQEELQLEPYNPKCSYTFSLEVGDYDIIVVANSPNEESVVQKFRIKV